MKTVYFKSGRSEWKYELDDEQHENIIGSITEDGVDPEEMLDESIETLRDLSEIDEEDLDEDDEIDQSIAVSFIWHYFNNLAQGDESIKGDIAIVEDDDEAGVSVFPATDFEED